MKRTKSSRQSQILSELDSSPSLRVAELARRLDVSTETIRRDLDELTGQGLLNRTYGGAVRPLSSEPSVTERHRLYVEERQRMARAALQVIGDGRVLMIGSGATTVHVARRIAFEMKNITVITHSFGVATVLAYNPTIKVLMLPGDYHASEGATVGAHAVSFLSGFYADYAITGASGLVPDGPSEALIECGAVYTAMVARAAKSIVVADHSKFDAVFPSRYAAWRQVSALITDAMPGETLAAALAANKVNVVTG
jgi:DeoR/GlpR family transcriptional regulator of sugar metabolism